MRRNRDKAKHAETPTPCLHISHLLSIPCVLGLIDHSFFLNRFMQESQSSVLSELESKHTAITTDIQALQKKQKVTFPPSPYPLSPLLSYLRPLPIIAGSVWYILTNRSLFPLLLAFALGSWMTTVSAETGRRRTSPPQRHFLLGQSSTAAAATAAISVIAPRQASNKARRGEARQGKSDLTCVCTCNVVHRSSSRSHIYNRGSANRRQVEETEHGNIPSVSFCVCE